MSGTPPRARSALARPTSDAPARRLLAHLVPAAALTAALAVAVPPARAQAPAACPAAAQPLGAAPAAAVEAAVGCLVNAERAARRLAPVERSGALERAAQRHAADMVARGYFAHVSPTGGTVDKRARRAGYLTRRCWALGENLGWAPPEVASAGDLVEAWMGSSSHRAVILDPAFRDIGIGLLDRAPVGDGRGATFVLELGAMRPCEGEDGGDAAPRAASRARVRAS
jgi:uncharacterized protein YkwD